MKQTFYCIYLAFLEFGTAIINVFRSMATKNAWEMISPILLYLGGIITYIILPVLIISIFHPLETFEERHAATYMVMIGWIIESVLLWIGIRAFQICKELKTTQQSN